jgi:hypothetical protein
VYEVVDTESGCCSNVSVESVEPGVADQNIIAGSTEQRVVAAPPMSTSLRA